MQKIIYLIFLIGIISSCNKKSIPIPPNEDSIKIEIITIKDTIKLMDTILEIINNDYEKEVNNILTQPTDSDCIFFSEYLSKNSKRLFNSYNSDTVKTN